jgi:hypothetical protein
MYPNGATVTGVPTLVLGGEYDLVVPESVSKIATDVMVGATYVGVAAAGHDPEFWSSCGPELVQRFFLEGAVGDTSCAAKPAGGWWIPGSFPTHVADAPAATQTSGPRAPKSVRRLATVAAWTVMDSIEHNFFVPGDSVALRGGTVDFEFVDPVPQWTLGQAHFTKDVTVDGTITFVDGVLDGEFTLTGPGKRTTTAHINGRFLTTGADMTITFDIDGHPATFTVPGY